jgi:hypothetical protein
MARCGAARRWPRILRESVNFRRDELLRSLVELAEMIGGYGPPH